MKIDFSKAAEMRRMNASYDYIRFRAELLDRSFVDLSMKIEADSGF